MRYVLLLLIVLLLLLVIAFTDFFLLRLVREKMAEINDRAQGSYGYKPISLLNGLLASLGFWAPPVYLLGDRFLLELKIFITLIYWLVASIGLNYYLRIRSSKQTAIEALPFLVCLAVASGLILVPGLNALYSLIG